MLKLVVLMAGALSAVVAAPSAAKREISDTHHSNSFAGSFPLGMSDTLGPEAFADMGYPGSLGNLYAHDDEHLYDYTPYALGYGEYEPLLGPLPADGLHAGYAQGLAAYPFVSRDFLPRSGYTFGGGPGYYY